MQRLCLLQGKLWPAFFGGSQGVSFIDFLAEQRTINSAYYSKLLKDPAKSVFLEDVSYLTKHHATKTYGGVEV